METGFLRRLQARRNVDANSARLRTVLVTSQVALSLALLVAAGMFLQVYGRLFRANPGYDTRHVLVAPLRVGTIIAGAAPNLRRSIGTNKSSTSAASHRPLPHTAPHKLLAQVEHPAGRSRMLVAVHGLAVRSASDAIRAPLTELLKPDGCRAPPRSSHRAAGARHHQRLARASG